MPTSPASEEPEPEAGAGESAEALEAAGDDAELAALRSELASAQDRLLRARADLENYRKRAERDTDRRVDEARRRLLREWLDAVDSVELALRIEPGDPGLSAVLAQMQAILAREGVTWLDAVGGRFDPERHEAIAVQPSPDVPDQTVIEQARSGFVLDNGDVLRPAQVVVARNRTG